MYKKALDSFWVTQEVDVSADMNDWDKLTDDERHFISMILAFFSSSDGIVMENLAARFMNEVQNSEARAFYAVQICMETIHSEMYSILIDTYIRDETLRLQMFQAVDHYTCIDKKAKWAEKWIQDTNSPFIKRLAAFAIVEGVFFSGAFASIYWLKKRGIMHGLTFSNELISRDEALHTEFAVMLFHCLQHEVLPEEEMYEMMRDAVSIETDFICEAIPCRMIGMNSALMCQYIQFVADRLLQQLAFQPLYHVANPFDFMELISVQPKVNFFERVNSEYALHAARGDEDIFNDSTVEF
jgi:ribonucleoside-diphosphate reductase subunit M2